MNYLHVLDIFNDTNYRHLHMPNTNLEGVFHYCLYALL